MCWYSCEKFFCFPLLLPFGCLTKVVDHQVGLAIVFPPASFSLVFVCCATEVQKCFAGLFSLKEFAHFEFGVYWITLLVK